MTVAIAAYLGLTLLWNLAPNLAHLLIAGEIPGAVVLAWFLLLQGVSPTGAYNALVQRLLLGGGAGVEARIGGPAPSYLDPAVFLLVLLAWVVVPLLVGYRSFRRADLSYPASSKLRNRGSASGVVISRVSTRPASLLISRLTSRASNLTLRVQSLTTG